MKFDTAGIRLWGTYFGGNSNDAQTSFAMCIDAANNLYLTGNTQSSNMPTTAGIHQPSHAGNQDAFIAKWSMQGNLVWCTYYGGSAADLPFGIATDTIGNIYLTGYTQSAGGIATPAAHQTTIGGGQDAFIAKFENNGQRVWGTYIGGTQAEQCRAIAVSDDKVFVAGVTAGSPGLATNNAHQNVFGGGVEDGLLACLDMDGQQLWATYYGGSGSDNLARGIWCDGNSVLYLAGETSSTDSIATTNAINTALAGAVDICVLKFDQQGNRLWGTYLGGTDIDNDAKILGDRRSNIYVAGKTNSATGINAGATTQPNLGGGYDALLIKINDCHIPPTPDTVAGPLQVCAASTNVYSIINSDTSFTYQWLLPNGWSGASDSSTIELTAGNATGEIKVLAISNCGGASDTQRLLVTVLPLPNPVVVANGFALATTQIFSTYQWLKDGAMISGATQPIHLADEDGAYSVWVSNTNGCKGMSNTIDITGTVGVSSLPKVAQINLYPNPLSDYVFIDMPLDGVAQLCSADGRILFTDKALLKGNNKISLQRYAPGVYMLKIVTDKGLRHLNLIKE